MLPVAPVWRFSHSHLAVLQWHTLSNNCVCVCLLSWLHGWCVSGCFIASAWVHIVLTSLWQHTYTHSPIFSLATQAAPALLVDELHVGGSAHTHTHTHRHSIIVYLCIRSEKQFSLCRFLFVEEQQPQPLSEQIWASPLFLSGSHEPVNKFYQSFSTQYQLTWIFLLKQLKTDWFMFTALFQMPEVM